MKNTKKFTVLCAAVLMLATSSVTAFAASAYNTPAEAAADVTGKSLEEVTAERQTGKAYGTIAAEAGKLEEFQSAVLEMRKDSLDAMVADGIITQAQADTALAAIENRQAACNGTGLGMGAGCGQGAGLGRGRGMGIGRRNGSCLYQ